VRREEFHRDFLTQALARDRVRLRFLEVDGRPVAALYNLRLNGAESNYQAGRDPGLAALSVGTLLHMHAMRDALAEGASEYRFLRGAESYKLDFANADPGLVAVALTRRPVAGSIVPPLKVVPGLRRPLRRRVPAAYSWGTGSTPLWGEP
jgi:CelD/BcsL family acetyltransferase involved in cellulose biosynthesis